RRVLQLPRLVGPHCLHGGAAGAGRAGTEPAMTSIGGEMGLNGATAALREVFAGELTGPEDPTYEEARTVFNAMIDRRPALIARCATTADVAVAVDFAREHELV